MFVAVDGEGYTTSDGFHKFNLLGASDGSSVVNHDGLTTRECFDYLLELAANHKGADFVSFYFSYDANKILRGLSSITRMKLARANRVYFPDRQTGLYWFVEYHPKKWLKIARAVPKNKEHSSFTHLPGGIHIDDVFGFFQKSFLGSLQEFYVGTPEEHERIRTMKLQRGSFTVEEFEAIHRYNYDECRLLVDLMTVVKEKLDSVGIRLQHWHGAGAVASKILSNKKVKPHLYRPEEGTPEHRAIMSAYFGGRVQCLKVGKFRNIYGADINSAYPTAMYTLPSLKGCVPVQSTRWNPEYTLGLYKIEWKVEEHNLVTPLPFRNPNGTIEYPYSGIGWYWMDELSAVRDMYGDCFTILDGYRFEVDDVTETPFDFIIDMYKHRQRLKAAGDMAQIVLKLGLNSLYGKVAQGIGHKNQPPPFQCYIHAGLITARTRATMLRAAYPKQSSIISFATDGVLSTEPLGMAESKELGGWDLAEYERAFVIKPGFYRLLKEGYKEVSRVRGFPSSAIKAYGKPEDGPDDYNGWETVETVWDSEGLNGFVIVPTTQFIGLKSVSASRPWGEWVDVERKLRFHPSRGNPLYIEGAEQAAFQVIQEFVKWGESAPYYKGIHEITDPEDFAVLEYLNDNLD